MADMGLPMLRNDQMQQQQGEENPGAYGNSAVSGGSKASSMYALARGMATLSNLEYVFKWITFLLYFSFSWVLYTYVDNKTGCFVQHTYRQEFMANVVANPLYSSTAVVRDAPVSQLETQYYHSPKYTQRASDIAMFPNVIVDPLSDAAFLPVALYPQPLVAAGEMIPVSPAALDNKTYYYDPAARNVFANGMGPQGGATAAVLNSMLNNVHGPWRAGMQLPNLKRCMNAEHLTSESEEMTKDVGLLTKWLVDLKRLEINSHLRGTCLLSGVQATVDMTSNYKTSAIPFSSVNVLFMVLLILWISASFCLFYIGGWNKASAEVDEATFGSEGGCCGWFKVKLDDIFMFVAILWNFLGIVYVLMPSVREHNSIPANNAIIACVALVITILVQWRWAHFHEHDLHIHETAAAAAMQQGGENGEIQVAEVPGYAQEEQGQQEIPRGIPVAEAATGTGIMFSTHNFLSTASAVRNYGVQYAKQLMDINQNKACATFDSGLRKRNGRSLQDEYDSKGYQYARVPMPRKQKLQRMPNFMRMVKTGSPIVKFNYMNILKSEMFDDSIQGMEYTITTPLLFATLLAAISPAIPTGMVQWVFGSLLASHILCIPILYLGHLSSTYSNEYDQQFHWTTNAIAVLCFFVACATMQIIGLSISGIYFTSTDSYFHFHDMVRNLVIVLFVMQSLFVLTVVAVTGATMLGKGGGFPNTLSKVASIIYMILNIVLKLILGYVLAEAARYQEFPVLTCNVWSGGFFFIKA